MLKQIKPLLDKEKTRVIIWSEGTEPRKIYPEGINGLLSARLQEEKDMNAKAVFLNDTNQGLTKNILMNTDVLIWFGHHRHHEVNDALVDLVAKYVKEGMGMIALHSSHFSKIFQRLLDSYCSWESYIENAGRESLTVVDPHHPIAEGLSDFDLPQTEMYTEEFDVPTPDSVVMEGRWQTGEKSREVLVWTIGRGKVVYLRAGHETYPIYFDPSIQKIIVNAVRFLKQSRN